MKTKQLFIPLLFISFWVSGQTIFERYADNNEVTLVSISPKMFKMFGQMNLNVNDPEAQEYLDMVSSISNFKVLISSNHDISKEMLSWVKQQVSKQNLDELMSIKDQEADVTFYIKEGKKEDYVEQLLMYVNEHKKGQNQNSNLNFNGREIKAVLMLLEGMIDLNKISKLTDQMNLPGGNQLKKAQQKKAL